MRIGLFGGTFDPPHEAHQAATLLALKRLKLDRVWWLVTPGNPLKDTSGLAPLETRIAAARALTHHPRIDVTGLEAVINTRYTYDTIKWLIARCPGRSIRLDHGRRQFAELSPLAEMARNSKVGAVRGHRSPGAKPLCRREPGRPGSQPAPAFPKTTPPRFPSASRRPGLYCTDSNRRCRRPRCAPCAGSTEPRPRRSVPAQPARTRSHGPRARKRARKGRNGQAKEREPQRTSGKAPGRPAETGARVERSGNSLS